MRRRKHANPLRQAEGAQPVKPTEPDRSRVNKSGQIDKLPTDRTKIRTKIRTRRCTLGDQCLERPGPRAHEGTDALLSVGGPGVLSSWIVRPPWRGTREISSSLHLCHV